MHSKKELIKFMKVDRLSIEVVAAFPRQSYTVKLDVPVGTSKLSKIQDRSMAFRTEVPTGTSNFTV